MPPSIQEQETAEFERRRKEIESQFDAKTAKNRAKRQKKKERAREAVKSNPNDGEEGGGTLTAGGAEAPSKPIKKRRLVNGKGLVFKRPGKESDSDDAEGDGGGNEGDEDGPGQKPPVAIEEPVAVKVVETPRITIIEDDF